MAKAERLPSTGLSSLLPSGGSFSSLVKQYDPRKLADVSRWTASRTRRACEGPPEGHLLLWMGRLRRWKRRWFCATSPGLLVYCKGQHNRAQSSAINLQMARIQHNGGHQIQIITSNGLVCFLRCASVVDREAWVHALQESIATYARMLSRATLILQDGSTPGPHGLGASVDRRLAVASSGERAQLALIEDQSILSRLDARLQASTSALAPAQHGVTAAIEALQTGLVGLAASLGAGAWSQPQLTRQYQPSGPHVGPHLLPAEAQAPSEQPSCPAPLFGPGRAAVPAGHGSQASPASGDEGNPVTSRTNGRRSGSDSDTDPEQEDTEQAPSRSRGRRKRRSSSFRHAHVASMPDSVGAAWSAYTSAVADAIRKEALRVVELEAENAALQGRVRETVLQLKRARNQLRAVEDHSANTDAERRSSASQGEGGSGSDHELLDDVPIWFDDSRPISGSASADGRKLAANVSGLDEEYFEALEAFEAVQHHDYLVRASSSPLARPRHSPHEPAMDQLWLSGASDAPTPEDEDLTDDGEEDGDSGSPALAPTSSFRGSPWAEAAARVRLPAPQPTSRGFSIWSVLKNAIGRDLTRITLPATINEPTSALQRLVEDLQYRDLLEAACSMAPGPDRMLCVVAFALSGYAGTLERVAKPFNPLLGETYEWRSADEACKFLAEQVSHHPPVSCWWAEGPGGWRWWGEMEMRSRFWGKSVEMAPVGQAWLQLPDGSLFTWNKPVLTIHNLVLGRLWLDWHGDITVRDHSSGASATVKIPRCGGTLESRGNLSGVVLDSQRHPQYTLSGSYASSIHAHAPPSDGAPEDSHSRAIFTCAPLPEDADLQYSMTAIGITLNAPVPGIMAAVAPTDSRHRTDQRALEVGDLALATPEKMRLEEKQRAARRHRKETAATFHPLWFRLREPSKGCAQGADHWLGQPLVRTPDKPGPSLWVYDGAYFSGSASAEKWGRCPDLYGPD